MADLNGGRSGDLVGRQQPHRNEGVNGLSQEAGLSGILERELGESGTAAGGVLFGRTGVDQAYK